MELEMEMKIRIGFNVRSAYHLSNLRLLYARPSTQLNLYKWNTCRILTNQWSETQCKPIKCVDRSVFAGRYVAAWATGYAYACACAHACGVGACERDVVWYHKVIFELDKPKRREFYSNFHRRQENDNWFSEMTMKPNGEAAVGGSNQTEIVNTIQIPWTRV